MGELLDRKLQHEILNRLAADYPRMTDLGSAFGKIPKPVLVNLLYLEEHGLVATSSMSNRRDDPISGRITAQGLDFLADDGGLTAILRVLTVRFDERQLKEILIDRVRESDESGDVKTRLISTIKDLPSDLIKDAVLEAAKTGLKQVPDIARWIAGLVG